MLHFGLVKCCALHTGLIYLGMLVFIPAMEWSYSALLFFWSISWEAVSWLPESFEHSSRITSSHWCVQQRQNRSGRFGLLILYCFLICLLFFIPLFVQNLYTIYYTLITYFPGYSSGTFWIYSHNIFLYDQPLRLQRDGMLKHSAVCPSPLTETGQYFLAYQIVPRHSLNCGLQIYFSLSP